MVERATDMDAIARILNHPKVYDGISDDLSVFPFVPDPSHFCLINEEKTGVVRIDPVNSVTCAVHIAALPELWGRVVGFVKEGIEWTFKNTLYSKIIGFTPENNRSAVALAKRCGFKEEGRIVKSFLKHWELHDQIVFGLSKYS